MGDSLTCVASLFFLLRKESKLEFRKLYLVLFVAFFMTLIWDHAAMKLGIWDFPRESVSRWFLGVPVEEYIFAIGFVVLTLGIYTSLPHFRQHIYDGPRLNEIPLLCAVFAVQFLAWLFIIHTNAQSYIKWLLFLAIPPSLFYLWRKGEKVDEVRMFITAGVLSVLTIVLDVVFIGSNSWLHFDEALLGRIGIVPIDDILFTVFIGVSIIGLYPSLPRKHMLTGKW
ncbi:MAG: lycopene cyclase domain-containing protein [Patescibacteria group bacterium]